MDLEVRVVSSGMDGSLGFSALESSATGGSSMMKNVDG